MKRVAGMRLPLDARVAVTGATGYIASELVKQLLAKGYIVHATVRSKANTERVQHLLTLAEALPGELELFEADLLQEGSFDQAVAGCRYVFHTASPFFINVKDPQAELVQPAVQGTRNLLASVARAKDSVKRVVLTSSIAAVLFSVDPAPPKNGSTYTEEDWNEVSTLQRGPYPLSKTLAEKAAWELAKQHGLDLVAINPTFVLGPVLSSRTDAESIIGMKKFLENQTHTMFPRCCDVRDVARAHIAAAELPQAHGRYMVSHPRAISSQTISRILQERFPELELPPGEPERPQDAKVVYDTSKLERELGFRLRPVAETYIDMATTMIQLGVATPVLKQDPSKRIHTQQITDTAIH